MALLDTPQLTVEVGRISLTCGKEEMDMRVA